MAIVTGILCFSPTNTTRTICEAIAKGLGDNPPRLLDMTSPGARAELLSNSESLLVGIDHLIVGAPVYAGKLPALAVEALNGLDGNGTTCSAVVVYGGRDYGVALRRLVEMLMDSGFAVVSSGAFIGQHSYFEVVPIATGRPDEADLHAAQSFGETSYGLSARLQPNEVPKETDIFSISPWFFPTKPTHRTANCRQCGACAEHCTAGVISAETGEYTDKKHCVGCTACVRVCPNEGRAVVPSPIMHVLMKIVLGSASRTRREPQTQIAGMR
jgi:Pyruvate/2-oxoacid:ferredoxin oxidoreductase delta subunit